MTGNLALASLTAIAVLGASGIVGAQDMKRCDQLADYYDRYSKRISEGRTPVGRVERELGYAECRKGNFAAGAKMLEEAIRRSGYSVPAS
jgi:hypothetical protein